MAVTRAVTPFRSLAPRSTMSSPGPVRQLSGVAGYLIAVADASRGPATVASCVFSSPTVVPYRLASAPLTEPGGGAGGGFCSPCPDPAPPKKTGGQDATERPCPPVAGTHAETASARRTSTGATIRMVPIVPRCAGCVPRRPRPAARRSAPDGRDNPPGRRRSGVRDVGPTLDLVRLARFRPDISGRRANQPAGLLLLHDVRRPPSRPR